MSLRDEWKARQWKGEAGFVWKSLDEASEWTVFPVSAKRLTADDIRRTLPNPFDKDD